LAGKKNPSRNDNETEPGAVVTGGGMGGWPGKREGGVAQGTGDNQMGVQDETDGKEQKMFARVSGCGGGRNIGRLTNENEVWVPG